MQDKSFDIRPVYTTIMFGTARLKFWYADRFSIKVSIVYTTNFGGPIYVFRHLTAPLITNTARLTIAPFKQNPAVIVMKVNIRGLKHGGCKSKQKLGTLLVLVHEKTTEFAAHKI